MSRLSRKIRQHFERFLHARGYRIEKLSDVHFLESLLYSHLKNHDELFFVQIGANDGKTSDPIYQFVTLNQRRVRGLVVEPVRDYFEQLKKNYAKYPNVTPVNVAIHSSEKEMTLYRVDPDKLKDLPQWAKGIASFDRSHHELSGIPAEAIVPETVRCTTFDQLLADHQVSRIDLLQIDTEGYDAEILRGIDFDAVQPKIIRFEHGLAEGIMSRETFSSIADMLHAQGYELVVESHDATACQRETMVKAN